MTCCAVETAEFKVRVPGIREDEPDTFSIVVNEAAVNMLYNNIFI